MILFELLGISLVVFLILIIMIVLFGTIKSIGWYKDNQDKASEEALQRLFNS